MDNQNIIIQTNFQGIILNVNPNTDYEWLMTTQEVAKGYGVTADNIRMLKQKHLDELQEEKHFLRVNNTYAQKLNIQLPSKVRIQTFWTKEGVIMLGFFIKSENAKIFRKWASQLILNHLEGKKHPQETDMVALEERLLAKQKELIKQSQTELIQTLKQDLLQATQGLVDTSIADNNLAQREQYWQYLDAVYQMLDQRLQNIEPPKITAQDIGAYFYLFQKKHTTEYKFGKSIQPLERLVRVQANSGNDVTLILAIQMPTEAMALELENYLKKHFKTKRIRSEWFDLNANDVNFIRMIAQSFETYLAQQS